MKRDRIFLLSLLLGVMFTLLNANKLTIDSVTSLVNDVGLEDVKENCTVCHTGRFIVMNGGDKKFWYYKIRLMQKGFGLWKIKPDAKQRIIEYLSKYYSKKHNISLEEH